MGFINGTVCLCRSQENQRIIYNAYKTIHAIKFQSTVAQNGLIAMLELLLLATWRGGEELVTSSHVIISHGFSTDSLGYFICWSLGVLYFLLSFTTKGLFNCRYNEDVWWRRPVPPTFSMLLTTTRCGSTCWELRIKIKVLTKINGKRERKAFLTVILIADWSETAHNCPPELSSFYRFWEQ